MILWSFALYCLLIITLCQSKIDSNRFRLPRTVIPVKYKLHFFPVLKETKSMQKSFARIYIRCIQSTNTITLHSRDLKITRVNVTSAKHTPGVKKFGSEPKYEFLHIYLKEDLKKNILYILDIHFVGKINQDLSGLYKSYYKDKNGKKVWLLATQFEPTNARAAFPCFDEPDMRAKFQLNIGHPTHLQAFSNMPLKYTTKMKNSVNWGEIDTFETSVSMSTYLVAFVVSDFKFETTNKINRYGETLIRIYTKESSLSQVNFAKEVVPKTLAFFEEYFEIPYPLPKADFVALPDFDAGAMENWGLILFRESMLLCDPKLTSLGDKQEILYTIAHEIAHMWFGNLVTVNWWDDTWLKEGFATFLGNLAVAHVVPEWKYHALEMLINDVQTVYKVDALQHSRPITVPITDPNFINQIFDGITYSKGACVIVMMERFLGSRVLRKGLQHYLNKYKYGSARKDQLWHSISIVAHSEKALSEDQSVNKIMDTWITQPGYPLVTIFRDYNGTVRITQQRYLENTKNTDNSCYWIPLTYTTEKEGDFKTTKPKHWLSCPKKSLSFKDENPNSWIIFNIQLSGLYKTNYDTRNWNMLIRQLENNHTKIDILNRVILIDDVMGLAMTGHVPFRIAFDLINYVRHDKEVLTWTRVLEKLAAISRYLTRTENYELIQTHVRKLIKPFYKRLKNADKANKLDELIMDYACSYGIVECENEAVEMFQDWMKHPSNNSIPENIRSLVYCTALKKGGATEWKFLWKRYLSSQVGTEKSMILLTLGCTRQAWLLSRYIRRITKKDSGIRNQDASLVFYSVATKSVGFLIARAFFYENIKEIYDIQSPKGKQMIEYITPLLHTIKTDREIEEYKIFVKRNEEYLKQVQFSIKQSLEIFEIRRDWYKNQHKKIIQALSEFNK